MFGGSSWIYAKGKCGVAGKSFQFLGDCTKENRAWASRMEIHGKARLFRSSAGHGATRSNRSWWYSTGGKLIIQILKCSVLGWHFHVWRPWHNIDRLGVGYTSTRQQSWGYEEGSRRSRSGKKKAWKKIGAEALSALKYLDCCIKETLRLYPSVPAIMRELGDDQVSFKQLLCE